MKRSMVNASFTFLWHKCFSHISKERLGGLVKNETIPNLDFTDFGLCVECIKGKQTKHSKKGDTRSNNLLEIIHIDICGPFKTPSFTKEKQFFITFIDDFSRYGYVYLFHEKSLSINALEVFVNEVEKQLDRKVKIIRSDRGGEYYGKYDKSRLGLDPFAKFIKSHGICAQYTMPSTVQQNGVAERQNRTLMEMVRSMIRLRVVDTISKPLKIYCDNVATIFFSKNDKYSKGAKHMDIKFFIMKEEIKKQRVYLEHISTDLMIVDPLTKGLPPKAFTQHATKGLIQAGRYGGGGETVSPISRSMRLDVPKFLGTDPDRFNLEGDTAEWFRWMTRNNFITTWDGFSWRVYKTVLGRVSMKILKERYRSYCKKVRLCNIKEEDTKSVTEAIQEDALESYDISILNSVVSHGSPRALRVALDIQGLKMDVDLYVLPMKGPDIVLGIQWLQKLGMVTHAYSNQTMKFSWSRRDYALKGEESLWLKQISLRQMRALLVPTALPPHRSIDHRIHLYPNTKRVNVHLYFYSHYQKREMEKLVNEMISKGIIRSKCVFGASLLEYLGHIISGKGVEMDSKKVVAVREWPIDAVVESSQEVLQLPRQST
nr:putative zinc finger, CCHC-type [Tanacetum cinerariifolium]